MIPTPRMTLGPFGMANFTAFCAFAAEGAIALRDWAKSKGMGPLCSCIAPENTRSVALAKRLGCTLEAPRGTPAGKRVDVWRHPA